MDFWNEELKKLRSTPNSDIFKVLKISFDGLDNEEKDVFLDIACFHNWTCKDKVRRILRSCGLFPDIAFPILIEKSLISIQVNQVCMHQLLQDMGRHIVRCELDNPGERSRLWDYEDMRYVLTKKKGTDKIKSISLNLSEMKDTMILEEDALVRMDRLKFFRVYRSGDWNLEILQLPDKLQLPHCGVQFFSDELTYVCWHGWPLEFSALRFCAQNLVELDMSYSKFVTLWEGPQEFVNLKILNLEGSDCLVRIPDLSKAPNIVRIKLKECESLFEVHLSIQYLDKLENLDLTGCPNLEILPGRLDSNVLTYLSIASCNKVKKCPELPPCSHLYVGIPSRGNYAPNYADNLESGRCLILEGSGITELPLFVESAGLEEVLNVSGCKNLSQLPNWLGNFNSMNYICLSRTPIIELPQSIENLTLLEELDLCYCEKLESLPTNLHRLSSLSSINIEGCKHLRSIPKLPPLLEDLYADYCDSLENFSDNSIDDIREGEADCYFGFRKCFKLSKEARNNIFSFALSAFQKCFKIVEFILPGSEIPPWICEQAMGSSINVQTPSNFAAVLCCIVFKCDGLLSMPPERLLFYGCRCKIKGDNVFLGGGFNVDFFSGSSDDEMVLFNLGNPEGLGCDVVIELSFEVWAGIPFISNHDMKVKKCGICFLNDNRNILIPSE